MPKILKELSNYFRKMGKKGGHNRMKSLTEQEKHDLAMKAVEAKRLKNKLISAKEMNNQYDYIKKVIHKGIEVMKKEKKDETTTH